MRTIIILLFSLFFSHSIFAQIKPGFDKYEGRDMISLCNSFTQIGLFNTDVDIVPSTYKKYYTSGIYGLDNKFQIWRKSNYAVIVFRGSTAEKSSWLENMYSVMISAEDQIVLPGMDTVKYKFASDDNARVQAGWSLGVAFLIQDLVHEINLLNKDGIYDFFITGHSQGGALSHLSRAFLENLPEGVISAKCQFKTYAFASPMVGNEAFVKEYTQRFVASGMSFSIYNPDDMVPKMPITVSEKSEKIVTLENFESLLDSNSNVTFKSLGLKALTKTMLKDPVKTYIKTAGYNVHNQIEKKLGHIIMPKYSRDLNYISTNKKINIGSFDKLSDQIVSKEEEGDSLPPTILDYRKRIEDLRGGKMYQHKPYNYYLYFLKMYFNNEYQLIIKEERYEWNNF